MQNNENKITQKPIQKPISMVIQESKQAIANTINSVNLHPTLLMMIMNELMLALREQEQFTSEREVEGYNQLCNELKKSKESETAETAESEEQQKTN